MNPENIKQWLKDSGHDRQWLAKKCSVSKSTVDGWLSPNGARNIPKPSQSIIADLMYKEKPIEPRFTVEQFARIQKAARDAGLEVDTWIEKTIISALVLAIGSFAAFHLARSGPDFSGHSLAASAHAGFHFLASLIS